MSTLSTLSTSVDPKLPVRYVPRTMPGRYSNSPLHRRATKIWNRTYQLAEARHRGDPPLPGRPDHPGHLLTLWKLAALAHLPLNQLIPYADELQPPPPPDPTAGWCPTPLSITAVTAALLPAVERQRQLARQESTDNDRILSVRRLTTFYRAEEHRTELIPIIRYSYLQGSLANTFRLLHEAALNLHLAYVPPTIPSPSAPAPPLVAYAPGAFLPS